MVPSFLCHFRDWRTLNNKVCPVGISATKDNVHVASVQLGGRLGSDRCRVSGISHTGINKKNLFLPMLTDVIIRIKTGLGGSFMKVLNYGSLNYDFVYQVDHITEAGETQASDRRETFCGGKGLNQSIALAKAGVKVFQGGTVGTDGQMLLDVLNEYGVDTAFVRTIDGETGHAVIQVDRNAQNGILLFGGANVKQSKEAIDQALDAFGHGDFLLIQNEINLLDYLIDSAFSRGLCIICNPSPFNKALHSCDFSKISIFMLNEVEGFQMTGKRDPDEILDVMAGKFPEAEIVLTMGEEGSVYHKGAIRVKQDCVPADVIDTTAAGDTFTGYFIAGIINGMCPSDNLKRCAKASSIAVSRKGAAPSIPQAEEV